MWPTLKRASLRWSGLLKGLGNVVSKELKELLRDPKILIGMIILPLIMFPLLGTVIGISIESTEQRLQTITVGVADFDQDEWSKNLTRYLSSIPNVIIINIAATNLNEAVAQLQTNPNATDLIVIPEGFSANISNHKQATVKTYSVYSGKGLTEGATSSIISQLLMQYNRYLAPNLFKTEAGSIVKGQPKEIDPRALAQVTSSQIYVLPVTVSILLIFAMQIAATSVASEKEEKTLETLLSLPIDRFTILLGKMTGSIVVAAVSAVTYMVGFNYYMTSLTKGLTSQVPVDLEALGLAPSLLSYILLGASLFVAILSALALAVILSAFTEDVRSAQSYISYLYIVIMFPMLLVMFSDINALPLALKIVAYAIPYTYPMLAAKAAFTGEYLLATFGIIYVALFTVTLLYVAARLFATEKILTARLRLRGLGLKRRVSASDV